MTFAHEVAGGALVRHQGKTWLKAQRDSKDYVNHYLVPARAVADLALVYIDPETELEILAGAVRAEGLVSRVAGQKAQPGDILAPEPGRHVIKALDVKKDGQRHLAYVDIESGEIRPRQERGAAAVYSGWSLSGIR